jgi:hypothetical protein
VISDRTTLVLKTMTVEDRKTTVARDREFDVGGNNLTQAAWSNDGTAGLSIRERETNASFLKLYLQMLPSLFC